MTHLFQVLPDDHGIRPAGQPDQCLYCKRVVGQHHAEDCVVIVRDVRYVVKDARSGHVYGRWTHQEPSTNTAEQCRFHRNESSWCKNNLRQFGRADFDLDTLPPDSESGCLCWALDLAVEHIDGVIYRATD